MPTDSCNHSALPQLTLCSGISWIRELKFEKKWFSPYIVVYRASQRLRRRLRRCVWGSKIAFMRSQVQLHAHRQLQSLAVQVVAWYYQRQMMPTPDCWRNFLHAKQRKSIKLWFEMTQLLQSKWTWHRESSTIISEVDQLYHFTKSRKHLAKTHIFWT